MVRVGGEGYPLVKVHDAGLFSGVVPGPPADYRLAVRYGDRVDIVDDPYRWLPTLGEVDLHLIGEGRHERLWDVLGAHVRSYDTPAGTVTGTSFAVWAPTAQGVRVTGDFDGWSGWAHPMRALGSTGVWELFVPGIGAGTRYKFRILGADGRWREKADPMAFRTEIPPATASVVDVATHEWGDDEWMAARAQRQPHAEPMSIYEVHLGSWRPGLDYREMAQPARRLPRRDRLHPRRAAAGRRAPVRRVVGLPGHVVLRADRALRHPRRLPVVRRPPAPARLRRDRRLGARALPARRVGAREVRRHPALRARRPAPRRAARLGHARVRLRPQGGAQLPRRQRAVLDRGVPHRRPARRRRRLDALPRLLPPRGAVAAQHPRRPREPRRGRVPAGDERHRLPDATRAW